MHFFRQTIINRIVFVFPYIIVAILVVLSFFCHPAREDLAIYYYDNARGLGPYVTEFYNNSSSRYFSFPLLFLIFNGDFIITHYYLVAIFLIIVFWASLYFFISVFTAYVIKLRISKTLIAWFATLFLVIFFTIAFDLATLLYWISGSITYLPSFILFLLLLSFLIKISKNAKNRGVLFFLCIVCTVCICGSNEISFYFLFATYFLVQWAYYAAYRKLNIPIAVLMITAILCFFLLIMPGGTSARAHHFLTPYSLSQAMLTSFLYTIRDLYQIVSMPVAWTAFGLAWIAGYFTTGEIRMLATKMRLRAVYIFLFCIIIVFFFYFLLYMVSGELLPPRANNLVNFYILIFICLVFFVLGMQFKGSFRFRNTGGFSGLVGIVLFAVFVTNRLFVDGLPNLLAGYFYNQVMNERIISATQAKEDGKKIVFIEPYDISIKKYSDRTLLGPLFERFSDKLYKYPDLIHYSDPVEVITVVPFYASYLQVDTIEFKGARYMRKGLNKK